MKITQVTFRRHVNTGDYTSFEIEATATLPEGSDQHDERAVALALQTYVDSLCTERLDAGKRGARGGKDVGEQMPEF